MPRPLKAMASGALMFDREEIARAVEIQNRAYRLLRWVSKAIERGFITFDRAHQYASEADAASDWISEHYANVPPDCRPPSRSSGGIREFGAYFASYLSTSFELREDPGVQLRSACGCSCWCCSYLAAAPRLVTKRVSVADKKRAEKLKVDYVRQLALDLDLQVPDSTAQAIATHADTSEDAAVGAYARELLGRCAGHPSSPASLALWRQFAWRKSGSPRPGFQLDSETILNAEKNLSTYLRESAP